MPFSRQVAEDLLVKAARHCCLCRQYKGTKIEVHHIDPQAKRGSDDADNGIPLCFDCHSEVETYNDQHPRGRKFRPAELKRLRDEVFHLVASGKLPSQSWVTSQDEDVNLVRFFSQCFDRPAFQDPFHIEGSIEAFDKAIEDTITAINTGCLRARDGQVLAQVKGKSYLLSDDWRNRMDVIVDMLRAIRSRYLLAIQMGQIHLGSEYQGRQAYHIKDGDVAYWMDNTRAEIIRIFSEICTEAGIAPLRFPRHRFR